MELKEKKYIEENYKKTEAELFNDISSVNYKKYTNEDLKNIIQKAVQTFNELFEGDYFEAEFIEDFCRINLHTFGKKKFGFFSSLEHIFSSFIFSDYLVLEILEDSGEMNKLDFLKINEEDTLQIAEDIVRILDKEAEVNNLLYIKLKFFSIIKILKILGE